MDFSKELDELSQAFKLKVPELSPLWAQCAGWVKTLTADYDTLRKENNTLRYALADSRNSIKDMQARQRKDLEIAAEEIIRRNALDLLPILDAMDLAVMHGEGGVAIQMTRDSLVGTLSSRGLKKIDTVLWPYNSIQHECVKKNSDGLITKEVRSGYTLNGKVLRAAQVEVG